MVIPELFSDRYEKCSDQKAHRAWRTAQLLLAKNQLRPAVAELRVCVELCPGNVQT